VRALLTAVASAGLFFLAGCNGGGETEASEDIFSGPTEKVTPTPDAASRGRSAVEIALRAGGLTIEEHGSEGRGTEVLSFGDDEESVVAAVSRMLGQPQTGTEDDCGDDPVTVAAFDALEILFVDGAFAGYFATMAEGTPFTGPGGLDLSTADFAKLERRVSAERLDSTLDGEVAFGSNREHPFGGFLENESETARLKSVYAGTTCFYR